MAEEVNRPFEIVQAAAEAVNNLLPTKSSALYEAIYSKFIKWCKKKNAENYSEIVLLQYLRGR